MLTLLSLQLYAAHLIADFLLQPNWIAKNKTSFRALGLHAAIHAITAYALVNISLNRTIAVGILGLAAIHVAIDFVKAKLKTDGWIAFLVDQAIHFVTVVLAAVVVSATPWQAIEQSAREFATNPHTYLFPGAYVALVFGGGYLVQKVTQSFLEAVEDTKRTLKPGLPNAGRYIGWVERILVLTFVLADVNEAVGFLLAVKALARYPEIKGDDEGHFTEYFLVGTLTSVGLALAGGLVVRQVSTWIMT